MDFETTGTLKLIKYNLKKEGYDINIVEDFIYLHIPERAEYIRLEKEIYKNIQEIRYKF
jgi:hypothetical protein